MDVVGVVHLGEVVEAAPLLGVGQRVGAPVVRDGDVALLDVDVGRSVLAHRAQLDQVAVGLDLLDGEQHIDGADDIVLLRVHRALPVDHRVGSAALLAKVHDGVGVELAECLPEELEVTDVPDLELDVLPRDFSPPECGAQPRCGLVAGLAWRRMATHGLGTHRPLTCGCGRGWR